MAKKESTFTNMVITLFLVTMVAAFALGGVYNMTKEPIELAKKAKTEAALKAVIPDFDRVESYKVLPAGAADSLTVNKGYKADVLVGIAVETYSTKGYDPTPIRIMVGFKPDGTIINTSLISHKETPGLGTKMGEPKFAGQFMEKHPDSYNLIVTKDGGDVDAITAATISSRAFCEAVTRAYNAIKNEGGNN